METQNLRVDGKLYTRVVAAFLENEKDKGAFERKGVCQRGSYEDALEFAQTVESREVRFACLSWFHHPDLRELVLDEAIHPEYAKITLVRLF